MRDLGSIPIRGKDFCLALVLFGDVYILVYDNDKCLILSSMAVNLFISPNFNPVRQAVNRIQTVDGVSVHLNACHMIKM